MAGSRLVMGALLCRQHRFELHVDVLSIVQALIYFTAVCRSNGEPASREGAYQTYVLRV